MLTDQHRAGDQRTAMAEWFSMIERLAHSSRWASEEGPCQVVQTHISVVLLGRRLVLKLKKPVNFGFLDYTTLEKRRAACEAEVRLNRRLCPDTYLGVQTVVEQDGVLGLGTEGHIIDYAVLMKRLPAEGMLDRMVADDGVTESVIDRVACRLATFHRAARRGPDVEGYGSPPVIRRNWEENFEQTARYIGRTITEESFGSIRSWVYRWLDDHDGLLQSRVRDGWICEGHGDVRCESVCVTSDGLDGVCIFDCIEFNERFRCGDVAGEAAFLAMDLDARGRPDSGYYFAEQYAAHTADTELFTLLPFYRCYRAFVRGKVLSFRLDELEFSAAEQEAAAARAQQFFELARRYATPLQAPTVIAVAGLSGTGKTSLARAVAGELGLRVVSSDAVRTAIFGENKHPANYGEDCYSAEADRVTYNTFLDNGRARLQADGGVVLDATFKRATDRAAAREMAAAAGARWRLIECRLSPDQVKARLARRAARQDGLSDATWETYLRQRAEFDLLDEAHDGIFLALDMSSNLATDSRIATDWLRPNNPVPSPWL